MSEEQRHDIVETGLDTFAKELELRILDGWGICPTNPGTVAGYYGGTFTVTVVRNEKTLSRAQLKLESVKDRPKAGGAASLAKARAAKAAKKAQTAQKE